MFGLVVYGIPLMLGFVTVYFCCAGILRLNITNVIAASVVNIWPVVIFAGEILARVIYPPAYTGVNDNPAQVVYLVINVFLGVIVAPLAVNMAKRNFRAAKIRHQDDYNSHGEIILTKEQP